MQEIGKDAGKLRCWDTILFRCAQAPSLREILRLASNILPVFRNNTAIVPNHKLAVRTPPGDGQGAA